MNVVSNFKPLITLQKGLDNNMGVKIGILGSTNTREDGDPLGNAGVGLIQEFGSVTNKIPARSFLRMPLETKSKELAASLRVKSTKEKLLSGNLKGALQDVGFAAERIIDDAFKSRGFGNWAPNKPSTIKKKKSSTPLIDTRQLQRSITSKVVTTNAS